MTWPHWCPTHWCLPSAIPTFTLPSSAWCPWCRPVDSRRGTWIPNRSPPSSPAHRVSLAAISSGTSTSQGTKSRPSTSYLQPIRCQRVWLPHLRHPPGGVARPDLRRRGPPCRAGRCAPVDGQPDGIRDHQRHRNHPPAGVLSPHGRPPLRVRLVIQRLWPGHAPADRGIDPGQPVQPLRPDQAPRRAVGSALRSAPRLALPRPAVFLGLGAGAAARSCPGSVPPPDRGGPTGHHQRRRHNPPGQRSDRLRSCGIFAVSELLFPRPPDTSPPVRSPAFSKAFAPKADFYHLRIFQRNILAKRAG